MNESNDICDLEYPYICLLCEERAIDQTCNDCETWLSERTQHLKDKENLTND